MEILSIFQCQALLNTFFWLGVVSALVVAVIALGLHWLMSLEIFPYYRFGGQGRRKYDVLRLGLPALLALVMVAVPFVIDWTLRDDVRVCHRFYPPWFSGLLHFGVLLIGVAFLAYVVIGLAARVFQDFKVARLVGK